MSNLRPESRIKSLEKRATDIEAAIEELSSDQAEELKAIRQDIKQLSEGITASYVSIGDTFMATWDDIKATLATKEDLAALEGRVMGEITELKATMATKDDIASIKATQDQILALLQTKPPES